jgi:hypothetical protein
MAPANSDAPRNSNALRWQPFHADARATALLSIFVWFAIGATLYNLHVPLPGSFPTPKMNDEMMTVGMTVFLWLFLTPFILIGLCFAGVAISGLFGRTEVRITNSQATVFTGIGALGWKRRFRPSHVKSCRVHQRHNSEGSDTFTVLVETREGKEIKFGALLSNERRQFIVKALRKTSWDRTRPQPARVAASALLSFQTPGA